VIQNNLPQEKAALDRSAAGELISLFCAATSGRSRLDLDRSSSCT
jgi:hypothetical protein